MVPISAKSPVKMAWFWGRSGWSRSGGPEPILLDNQLLAGHSLAFAAKPGSGWKWTSIPSSPSLKLSEPAALLVAGLLPASGCQVRAASAAHQTQQGDHYHQALSHGHKVVAEPG